MLTVDPNHVSPTGTHSTRFPADLAIVVPTFNEAENVPLLVEKLEAVLSGHAWEVIFVDDDSPDGTAEIIRRIGRTKPHVHCLQRIGRRGLSTAVIEGALSTNAPYIAVMDADLQHDESILVAMLRILENREADIVIGSRYTDGGGVGEWSKWRQFVSRAATKASSAIIGSQLTDPMSGFFMLRRDRFTETVRSLSGNGYKILFDLLASSPTPLRTAEVPYCFRSRAHGESKLDASVIIDHAALMLAKSVGRYIPMKLLLLIGLLACSLALHLSLLQGFLPWFGFSVAQTVSSFTALTAGYILLLLTRPRATNKKSLFLGLIVFYLIASIGLVANISLSGVLFDHTQNWWMAGSVGATIGTLWGYTYYTSVGALRTT